jgi:hypothetical protein
MEGMETRLIEEIRDIQTELLRGMAAFSDAITLRMRAWEA